MRAIALALVCLVCTSHGRRVHSANQRTAADVESLQPQSDEQNGRSDPMNSLAMLLLAPDGASPSAGWQVAGGRPHTTTGARRGPGVAARSPLFKRFAQQSKPSPRRASLPRMQGFSFDPFDRDVFRILMDAQTEAIVLGATAVGTEHLVLAATMQKDDVQASLKRVRVTQDAVRDVLRKKARGAAGVPGLDRLVAATAKEELLPFAQDTERALKASVKRSKEEGALANEQLISWQELMLSVLQEEPSGAADLLEQLEVEAEKVYGEVQRGNRELVGAGQRKKGQNTTLDKVSTDLTQLAREGRLDPLIGRSAEVKRAMQILVRRRKNNPVLIGDPGVGKTAIAEGLAQRIAEDDVPPSLKGVRLLALEIGLLVADTKYRGEFEQRVKEVLDEVTKSNDTILFIDEIHTLVGAGSAEGGIDASNLMKPPLARGQLQCMGATTVAEYRKYIEKDAALERRFQPITVDEPSVEETTEIITTLSKKYEEHHKVNYTPEALEQTVKLSARYIPDRFLPDKAIDLMDEAGSLKQIDSYIEGSEDGLVSEDDVANVVSEWTGIPVNKLTADEAQNMLGLESKLHERVIGQDFAVSAIARALRRARAGIRSARRPVASMVFCGPTGVGKTELAKAVADLYYGNEKSMVRLDMSEYMDRIATTRLIGSPPGYVGFEEGGQLTDAVRRNPHTVILLDEIEKAHPDVFNILLQVLDDGRLTDNKGRVIDFSNTMLIMTSNVGSRKILDMMASSTGGKTEEEEYGEMRAAVKTELSRNFRPEFLNRLDELIVFQALNPSEVTEVTVLLLQELTSRCKESNIELATTKKLLNAIVEDGYSMEYGARPLRRAMQRICEDAMAEAILDGFVKEGEKLELDHDGGDNVILKNAQGKKRNFLPQAVQGIEGDTPRRGAVTVEEAEPPGNDGTMSLPKTGGNWGDNFFKAQPEN